jgi:periplasmic copper chaperone A
MTTLRLAVLAASALVPAPLLAHGFKAGAIQIGHPWSRVTAPAQMVSTGYMTLTNTGKTDDRLLSATSPAVRTLQITTVRMGDGEMRTRAVLDGLTIPAGATVAFKPGGYHLMLIGLKAPLGQGAIVPATLRFQRAGKVRIAFKVEAIGYEGPDGQRDADAPHLDGVIAG